jgi:hypothetical protein
MGQILCWGRDSTDNEDASASTLAPEGTFTKLDCASFYGPYEDDRGVVCGLTAEGEVQCRVPNYDLSDVVDLSLSLESGSVVEMNIMSVREDFLPPRVCTRLSTAEVRCFEWDDLDALYNRDMIDAENTYEHSEFCEQEQDETNTDPTPDDNLDVEVDFKFTGTFYMLEWIDPVLFPQTCVDLYSLEFVESELTFGCPSCDVQSLMRASLLSEVCLAAFGYPSTFEMEIGFDFESTKLFRLRSYNNQWVEIGSASGIECSEEEVTVNGVSIGCSLPAGTFNPSGLPNLEVIETYTLVWEAWEEE